MDCVELLSLRAAFVSAAFGFYDMAWNGVMCSAMNNACDWLIQNHKLYLSQDPTTSPSRKKALLVSSRDILRQATDLMERRAANFRVPVDRIAGWRQNPTVYPYGYIWAAKSLYVIFYCVVSVSYEQY